MLENCLGKAFATTDITPSTPILINGSVKASSPDKTVKSFGLFLIISII